MLLQVNELKGSLKLITFDGDCTLYSDGNNFADVKLVRTFLSSLLLTSAVSLVPISRLLAGTLRATVALALILTPTLTLTLTLTLTQARNICLLLQCGLTIALVTAAGYAYNAERYETRIGMLLQAFEEKGLSARVCILMTSAAFALVLVRE
jgi:hypothetical protein